VTAVPAPTHVPARDAEGSTPPFPPALVEELLRLVVKAARAHQLYLPNNPIHKGALDAVRAAFPAIWAHGDDLALSFTETDIKWLDRAVLHEPSKSGDSLPWLFFKDGVREIRLLRGFEESELVSLLDILQRVRKTTADEDDLLTLLWEADFAHLRYRYIDLGMDPAAPLTDGTETPTVDATAVAQATHTAVEEAKASGIVNISDFDSTLYFLDEKEIDYLQAEIAREYAEDLRSKVTGTLLDIFEQQASPKVREEVLGILDNLMVHLLAATHFRGVAYMLREASAAAKRAKELTDEQKRRLADLSTRLSASESLSQLLQSLDDATDLPPQSELAELFDQLHSSALSTVFGWLSRMQSPRLRPLLESAAARLASANTAELVRLIVSRERDVSAEAIRRAGALKTPAAVQSLSTVLAGNDVELRRLTVQALMEIGSPSALQALESGVEDDDREVRIATVRAFAARSYRLVLPRLENAVRARGIRSADLTEKMAFFEAYGALCGNDGLEFLDTVLNGKGFLGRREDAELRACAAIALGRIGSPAATESLRKSSGEKDVVVRNAVNRALRGAST
jgi:HEAT repeat protein